MSDTNNTHQSTERTKQQFSVLRDFVTNPTYDQITRTLAEFMGWTITAGGCEASEPNTVFEDCGGLWLGGGIIPWSPTTNRDNLAEVLERLTPEQWYKVNRSLPTIYSIRSDASPRHGFSWWLLTCDPAIIARAVAEVVGK